jgi:hypothetical protein
VRLGGEQRVPIELGWLLPTPSPLRGPGEPAGRNPPAERRVSSEEAVLGVPERRVDLSRG